MSKTSLGIVLLLLLVILGGMFYQRVFYKTPALSEQESNKKTLHDLLISPNEMCTFKINDENTGVLYASESNFRIDFTHNNKGEITKSHMISDLINVFLWFDEKDGGIRVAWPIVLDNSELDLIAAKILDLGIEVESECSPWRVDSSRFELPDVDFKDFGKKIPGSIQEDESSPEKKTQCAACSNLDQKAATKCYQDLECN